ncbi:MAG: efflux RND transporter permease subunit [Anaerovibrio sp.]|uniref:efflux RND transporter permease subunit n=1 Tax=Anaerovibrio sp. TaxID=1872532 RepID=UPI0025D73782|nr:efflux RND transporter permease subunit [Anaerovibrio sp.]MCR5177050.1 efflux RND transporter permease subunit [Anaerovibrio sp.]
MNITKFSIARPVGISMIVALFVVIGLFSFYRIGIELLPSVNTPYITVFVRYPGASAESVEQQVVKPVEEALSSISNVKRISSTARYENARVTVELEFDANADSAAIDATKKVESIRYKLPDEADEPVVIKRDENDEPIVEVAVTSDASMADMYSKVDNEFSDEIQQAGGVSEIDVFGGLDKEVAVEVDKDRMASYKLTLDDIVSAIKKENQLLPSGTVYTDTVKSDVRAVAQFKKAEDIEKIFVKNSSQERIPITAVASIRHQNARVNRYGNFNGEASVMMEIYKNSDANVVETADNIEAKLSKLKKENPDYNFTIISNDADYVRSSLHNTLGTLVEGLITTGLVLFLFLRGWRSTAAVMIAIPTSLIATFFVMYSAGFTFNMMSLMGMTLCIGILVDDSVVVLENISRHLRMGEPAAQAAEQGRMEIGMAAIAITLCDAVTFLPIAFMSGMTGQFFRQFGLTIVFAGMFSLFVSFTLTPMLAAKLYRKGWQQSQNPVWSFMDRMEAKAVDIYDKLLKKCFRNQKKLVVGALLLFVGTVSLIPLGAVGAEFMPRTDEGSFQMIIELPVNRTVEETYKVVSKIEDKLQTIPEVKHYLAGSGGSNSYEGRVKVQLKDRSERDRSVWDIANEMRAFCAGIDNATIRVSETQTSVAGVSGGNGIRGGGALRIELRGMDNEKLAVAANKVKEVLNTRVKGVSDVASSYVEGLPELQITVDREKIRAMGVSVGDVQTAISSAISGRGAGYISNDPLNGSQDTDINVRFRGADGFKASDIASIPININGTSMFLGDVAQMTYGTGPVRIRRVDKQRAITIFANVGNRPLNDVILDVKAEMKNVDLGEGITYKFRGQSDNMDESFQQLFMALLMAMVLIYMLLAVLYESLITPFIRMFSLPLGIIGAVLFLLFTNNTLNLYSMIGILVMDGVVAKNGTLLLDYTMTLQDRGYSAYDAIVEAGKVRLKPIMMTTITMIVGMLPTALAVTEGAETRVSMAWVIIGGLITSTVFTLIIIPIIFMFFENHPPRTWFAGIRRKIAG